MTTENQKEAEKYFDSKGLNIQYALIKLTGRGFLAMNKLGIIETLKKMLGSDVEIAPLSRGSIPSSITWSRVDVNYDDEYSAIDITDSEIEEIATRMDECSLIHWVEDMSIVREVVLGHKLEEI